MRLTKFVLATTSVVLVLAVLTSSASAGRLSFSSNAINVTWARMNWRGGFGTVECEVILNKTLHSRSMNKTGGLLIGYVTAANVNRCPRGTATILRETLPWHVRYESFAGALPTISAIRTLIIGLSARYCEPTFGMCCLRVSTASEPAFLIYNRNTATGAITSVSIGGSIRCDPGGITGSLDGTSSSVSAVTVTLI